MNDEIDELLPKTQSRRTQDMNMKPVLLILGHLMGDENVRHPLFKDGLSQILRQGVSHLNMMVETAMDIIQMERLGQTAKKLSFKALETLMNFQQYFVQGLWVNDDPMMQLPGMDADEIKKYRKQLKDHQIPNGKIETFCRLSKEQRANLNLFDGNKAKLDQLEKVIANMPVVSVHQEILVEGEKMITAQDIITFKIWVQYENLPENECPAYVHSENYPFLKKTNWYFVMVDEKTRERVIQVERVQAKEGNKAMFEMKQRFGQAGKF